MPTEPAVQQVQVHISNPWGWLAALAAATSSITALIAVIFSRLSNRASLAVSRIDHNININQQKSDYTKAFLIKNYGNEKVEVKSYTVHEYNPLTSQLLMVVSKPCGFAYFQNSDHFAITHNTSVNPPYPSGVNINVPLDMANLPMYQIMYPKLVIIITLEYTRRGKVFRESVRERHLFEIQPFSASPTSLEQYPALIPLLP